MPDKPLSCDECRLAMEYPAPLALVLDDEASYLFCGTVCLTRWLDRVPAEILVVGHCAPVVRRPPILGVMRQHPAERGLGHADAPRHLTFGEPLRVHVG